ncbi:mechanosensitive ion channel [Phlyctema vagabunda]|uniref:Mechanosensitive ion channel n=1 Tax=Phlyctema vagabunda TaxID=108571 RepID=A0ABR4PLI8_9HELO
MSLRSPLSPRSPSTFSRQGFQPLDNANGMSYENDIPLTQVRTGGSTGARRPGEGVLGDFATQPTMNDEEKKGFFERGAGGKRRLKKAGSNTRVNSDGEGVSVNALGRFYNKVVNFSVVTRYFVYVLPVALLIAIPIIIGAVLEPNIRIGGMRLYLFFLWIEIIWLSLWISKLVSKAIPYVFMALCGVVSSGTRKYAQVLRALELPLSFVGWAVTSLVTFTALTSARLNGGGLDAWVGIMKKILVPILIASLLYLGEKTIIQLISINYHRRSFDGRIKDSKRTIHLLGLLFDASRTLFPMYCPEFREEDYLISDSIEAMLQKTGMVNKKSGSATPLRFIGDVGRFGDKVTSVFGNIASEITGKQVFNPNSAHSVVIEALEKTKSSEALAKRLWMSFVVEGSESLVLDDIEEVLGPSRKEEAEEAFDHLDNDGNGDISLDEMIMKVVEVGRDRKSIAKSMRDVGQAIGVLDQILVTILFVIVVFIFVAFQNTNFVTTLATAGTTLLSLSFVFAVTTQEFLGSCIFLFVKHPFDVGDRVDIVGSEKENLVVEQISLLYTIFKRIDCMKMVQVPNIVLNNLWIENITRSKAMKEQLEMAISFDTSLEDIDTLRKEMETFVRSPENSRDFHPDIILESTGIGSMDKLQLKIEIKHKSNWHNETVRAARRSKFMCALVLALRKVPINGPGGGGDALGGPSNPSYSVAVSDQMAAEAREKSMQEKDSKRLIPSAPAVLSPSDGKSSSIDYLGGTTETKAADALNARSPATDAAHTGGDLRDDETFNAPDRSAAESRRSQDIEDVRQDLLRRQSTKGRRKPGDHIPFPTNHPSLRVTPSSPRRDNFGTVDEEAEMGFSRSSEDVYDQQYNQTSYSGAGYNNMYSSSQGAPIHPLNSAPASSQPVTGRTRKLSLSMKPNPNPGV